MIDIVKRELVKLKRNLQKEKFEILLLNLNNI